jgi:hypothetical protein
MGDSTGGNGVVIAIRPRHRAQALCSCGWAGQPHLWLSSAKVDALVHAANHGCDVAVPLIQSETINAVDLPDELTVRCPGGCGASISVPLVITDTPSAGSDDGELRIRFTAEAPELHDCVNRHLRRCPSAMSWVDAALERAHS